MIQKDHIVKIATKLFLKHGVKSVTIDRIVKELHTSKRTVYKHFKDKNNLLTACLATYHAAVKQENERLIEDADNAIEAMGHLLQHIIRRANVVNPNFFNDILHYYPGLLYQSYRETGNFAHKNLEHLAQWGIQDGIFQADLDVEVTSKTVLAMLKMLKDNDLYPIEKYSKERLTFGILIPYMKGLCTEKGLKILATQEELFRVAL